MWINYSAKFDRMPLKVQKLSTTHSFHNIAIQMLMCYHEFDSERKHSYPSQIFWKRWM